MYLPHPLNPPLLQRRGGSKERGASAPSNFPDKILLLEGRKTIEPKYSKEQKIKIIEVKNEHGNMKYPEIEEHVNKNGIILDSYFVPMRGIEGTTLEGEIYDTYLYQIRLDDGTILEAINEDSLAVIDK